MISYNSSDVIQCLRQYDMFANSLNLIKSNEERNMIVKQLTKLEEKIIDLTNDIYEEEYNALLNKECELLDEEKNRLIALVELINQRLSYVEKRCNNHYQLTGESIDVHDVLGASMLDELENKLRIIDKYNKNIKLEEELNEDIDSLNSKISLASEKVDINKSLNVELENSFKKIFDDAFSRLGLYDLLDSKEDYEYAYYETEKSLTLAQLNYETAKNSRPDLLSDCQEALNDIANDYSKYKDLINTIKLIEIFNKDVSNYDELVNKRREINEILKGIKNEELLNLISDTASKQFNTIMMEEQDVNTYNDLLLEKDRKLQMLSDIKEENESEEFQSILYVLIENEKKKQERLLEEQRRIEEEEKKKRMEIERKKQEEILKRQKIIEEARKKEIEKRTKKLLEEQQNSVLQTKKKENSVSFETIKDESLDDYKEEIIKQEEKIEETDDDKLHLDFDLNSLNNELDEQDDDQGDTSDSLIIKNKVDIEKELFEEFNSDKINKDDEDLEKEDFSPFDDRLDEDDAPIKLNQIDDDMLDKIDGKMSNNSFPDMSIDDYMKNFNEKDLEENNSLGDFGDDFPSIPL